mgnify:CR=1 FL=1
MKIWWQYLKQFNKTTNVYYRRGKKDGIVEGIKQGISQGIMENSIAIAKKLLKENFSKEKVANLTGLSEKEIEKIK